MTIKDVAIEANLAVGTVSRVLNNRGYISEKTRNRVFDAMKKLNYRPDEVARSLIKKSTNTIGLIVPHIVHPYFAKLISCIEKAASNRNYKILLCNSRLESARELDYIEMCKSNKTAGVILCSDNVMPDLLVEQDIPVITIERNLEHGSASIVCDNYQGGLLAAEKLAENGCKKVIVFGGVRNHNMPADDRTRGFESVCRKTGMSVKTIDADLDVYIKMDYRKFIKDTLLDNPNTDGIFASSDLIAAQVIQVCKEISISIPGDIKLIGFDDVVISTLTTPMITTIRQPLNDMAEMAVSLLIKRSKGEAVPAKTIFPVTLVERESC